MHPRFGPLLLAVKQRCDAVDLKCDPVGPSEARQDAHDPSCPHPLDHRNGSGAKGILNCLDGGLASQHHQCVVPLCPFPQLRSSPAGPHADDELVEPSAPEHVGLHAFSLQLGCHPCDVAFISGRLQPVANKGEVGLVFADRETGGRAEATWNDENAFELFEFLIFIGLFQVHRHFHSPCRWGSAVAILSWYLLPDAGVTNYPQQAPHCPLFSTRATAPLSEMLSRLASTQSATDWATALRSSSGTSS